MNFIDQAYKDLSVERVHADVRHICEEIPSRLAGSESAKRMAEYSCAGLKAAGVTSQVHTIPGLVSFPEAGQLRVMGESGESFAANTLGHSIQTPPEGVTAALVNIGPGGYADYTGKNVAGKIVLVELSYHPGRHEKQRIAAEQGAIGCVMMNWGPPESTVVPYGSVKPVWGNPTPETFRTEMVVLPCIGISRTSGNRLRELMKQGDVVVQMHTAVENVWKDIHVTTGEIAAEQSDDFVVVGGHQDSWQGQQATDNAAGSACILELARFFSRHRKHLRRGVDFGFWTAHETGTMVGSTWYVDTNWDRLREHAVAYLQIDQPACFGTTRWGSVSTSELRHFQERLDKELLPADLPRAWRRTVKVGDASFFGVGVPMLAAQGVFTPEELKDTANANLGWWHHSLENTIDKLQWDTMDRHLQMYASYVWALCTAAVIPCEFVPVADEIVKRLQELKAAGESVGLDSVLASAVKLHEKVVRFDEAAAAVGQAAGDNDTPATERFNTAIKRLSRILLPLVGTAKGTYGHDPYSYTPQTTVLPLLYDVQRLAQLPEGQERWMLQTQLQRERNRLADALRDAATVIDGALA